MFGCTSVVDAPSAVAGWRTARVLKSSGKLFRAVRHDRLTHPLASPGPVKFSLLPLHAFLFRPYQVSRAPGRCRRPHASPRVPPQAHSVARTRQSARSGAAPQPDILLCVSSATAIPCSFSLSPFGRCKPNVLLASSSGFSRLFTRVLIVSNTGRRCLHACLCSLVFPLHVWHGPVRAPPRSAAPRSATRAHSVAGRSTVVLVLASSLASLKAAQRASFARSAALRQCGCRSRFALSFRTCGKESTCPIRRPGERLSCERRLQRKVTDQAAVRRTVPGWMPRSTRSAADATSATNRRCSARAVRVLDGYAVPRRHTLRLASRSTTRRAAKTKRRSMETTGAGMRRERKALWRGNAEGRREQTRPRPAGHGAECRVSGGVTGGMSVG
ncbi:hypothetical protein ERJ75_001392900 [Trypanosoma vivax]|nr:hypothetical protein ERJ75_001392900 [Trypanosoma vivax]